MRHALCARMKLTYLPKIYTIAIATDPISKVGNSFPSPPPSSLVQYTVQVGSGFEVWKIPPIPAQGIFWTRRLVHHLVDTDS